MLKVGDKAPNFSIASESGAKLGLKDFKGKTVILYFYPKDMTSGCTVEACEFRDLKKQFTKKNTVVLGVSKDSIERHQKFIEKYNLNFSLLADTEGEVCQAYGVIKEKSMYGRKFMGIERTTFVIGPDSHILAIYNKVKAKDHAKSVLNELK